MSLPDPRTLPAYLRQAGLDVSPADAMAAVQALSVWPGSLDAEGAERRLRIVLARDRASWRILPDLLRAWSRGEPIERLFVPGEAAGAGAGGRGEDAEDGEGAGERGPGGGVIGGGAETAPPGLEAGGDAVEQGAADIAEGATRAAQAASRGARRPTVDAALPQDLRSAIERYARATRPRPRRRRRPERAGRIDPRRTWRASRRSQGEPLRLLRAGRPQPPAQRVLLVDTSASMHDSNGWYAGLARLLARPPASVEVRAFDVDLVPGRWPHGGEVRGGGTRIGQSLLAYLRGPGRRLGSSSHVMLLSDGWETGDIAVLDRALRALGRRAGRVDWLCPLAGTDGFEPTCRGLASALRQGIAVYDVHDTASFARYVARLEGEGERMAAQGGFGRG